MTVVHIAGDPLHLPYEFGDLEYWIFVTKNCNMRCSYCFEEKEVSLSKPSYSLEQLKHFLFVTNARSPLGEHGIIFYGGEPLLNQEFIKEIIRSTKEDCVRKKQLTYVLQTNGTLLNKIDTYLLENLDVISVSIDGPKKIHDRFRKFPDGSGSYDKIMDNLMKIKSKFKGQTLAMITTSIDQEFSIYESVMDTIDKFDHVHWNIETPIPTNVSKEDTDAFLRKYKEDIIKLSDYWVEEMKKGRVRNIIPFQYITEALETGITHTSPPCGAGQRLIVVDLDGQCYNCDVIACDLDYERRKMAYIGNIWSGVKIGIPNDWIDLRKKPWEEKTEKGKFLYAIHNPIAKFTEQIP